MADVISGMFGDDIEGRLAADSEFAARIDRWLALRAGAPPELVDIGVRIGWNSHTDAEPTRFYTVSVGHLTGPAAWSKVIACPHEVNSRVDPDLIRARAEGWRWFLKHPEPR